MSQWKRIEQELSNFILLGSMMTTELRRFVAEVMFRFLYDQNYPAVQELDQSEMSTLYPNWYQILRQLLQQDALRELARNNEALALSLTREMLTWAKKTFLQFETTNSRVGEEQDLKTYQQDPVKISLTQWEELLAQLTRRYPSLKKNWDFYKKTLNQQEDTLTNLSKGDSTHNRLSRERSVLCENVLQDWRQVLEQDKKQQESQFLSQAFVRYVDSLGQKLDSLNDLGELLTPFYGFLGKAWNDSLDNWNKISWDDLEEYADSLKRDRSLRELADLLGRWRRAQQHNERVRMQRLLDQQEWKPNPYGKSEIIGIHHSGDLSRMLPSEVALLSSPETEILLSKNYVERKLLTFQYRSQDLSNKPKIQEEEIEEPRPDVAGPFILNIDTSGSMFGAPERVAKALALAILEIALKQKRRVFLISFSTGFKSIEMTGIEKEMTRFIDFLKMSFQGGTDIEPALEESLKMLETEEYQDADVLMISDFVIPRLSRRNFDRVIALRQNQAAKFHSLFITRRADPRQTPPPIFDQHWVYDLDHPGVMRQAVDRLRVITGEADEDG